MSRNKGTFNFSANFEPTLKEPLDSRQKVGTYADLTTAATWQDANGNIWLYDGIIVSVSNDSDTAKNGIYRLITASGYSNIANWKKSNEGTLDESNLLHKTGFASETKEGELVLDSGITDVSGLKFSKVKSELFSTPVNYGTGPSQPRDIAIFPNGDALIPYIATDTIMKVPANGGAAVAYGTGLNSPNAIAIKTNGDALVTNYGDNTVARIPSGGGAAIAYGTGLNQPRDIAIQFNGDSLVVNYGNNTIVRIPSGGGAAVAYGTGVAAPLGIDVFSNGDALVTNSLLGTVVKIPFGGGPAVAYGTGLNQPNGIAIQANGDALVANYGNNTIARIPFGGGPAVPYASGLSTPIGIDTLSNGDALVVNYGNTIISKLPYPYDNILKVDDSGRALKALYLKDKLYADLDGGKVPQTQSQPSTITYNPTTGIISFTDATGSLQTIDLPIENLFQNASYDPATQDLTLTTNGGGTIVIDLSTLVDLPEIVISANSNPSVVPSTGQKLYFRVDNGNYWIANAGVWGGPFLGVTQTEKNTWNAKQNAIGYTPFDASNVSQDIETDKTSTTKVSSVKQLYDWSVAKYQAILVSGTNIKTINGSSILGAGNLTVTDSSKEPAITGSGNTSDFWSGAKTFRNLATDVRAVVLTGLSTVSTALVTASDSILVSIGKLQAQISNKAIASDIITGTDLLKIPTPKAIYDITFATEKETVVSTGGTLNDLATSTNLLRFTNQATPVIISGLANPYDGKEVTLENNSLQEINILHQSISSTAINRLKNNNNQDLKISVNGAARYKYSQSLTAWVLINLWGSDYLPTMVGVNRRAVAVTPEGYVSSDEIVELKTWLDGQTTALTSSQLNTLYPTYKKGQEVICQNITTGPIKYEKVDDSTNEWLARSVTKASIDSTGAGLKYYLLFITVNGGVITQQKVGGANVTAPTITYGSGGSNFTIDFGYVSSGIHAVGNIQHNPNDGSLRSLTISCSNSVTVRCYSSTGVSLTDSPSGAIGLSLLIHLPI